MQAYICDRCGRVIGKDDLLARIRVGDVDQETEAYMNVLDADLCKACADAVKSHTLNQAPAGEAAPERKPKVAGKRPKNLKERIEVDTGKVLALKAAGWKVKDIAGDMGIGVSTVYAVLKARDKEAGNGIRTSMDKRGSKSP